MSFLQQELKKITDLSQLSGPVTFVGEVGYSVVSEDVRLRLEFLRSDHSTYNGLAMTMINRKEGLIDKINLSFQVLLGVKAVSNPNFKEGVIPHIWKEINKTDWYVYYSTKSDYQKMADAMDRYISMFQEPELSQGPRLNF